MGKQKNTLKSLKTLNDNLGGAYILWGETVGSLVNVRSTPLLEVRGSAAQLDSK